ncbi:MAG: desulfoferrodoxin [Ruminococcus sp.]|nr:desulfoferrodoxin [Ruminococcus sp.]
MTPKFFVCKACGGSVMYLNENFCALRCCGEAMTELVPGTTEAATEKHIPVFTVDGTKVSVTVGEVEHPMLDAHYIEWILITTDKGRQIRYLKPGEAPKAEFTLAEGEVLDTVYAYCNLHGLWSAKA